MTKERLTGRNPKNEREALVNQIPKEKKEYIEQDLAIAESIVKAFRDAGFEAKISELAQNLQDQYYYAAGNILLGERFRQLAKKAPFQWDKIGAINLVISMATPESLYGQFFEEVDPKSYPNFPEVKFPKAGEDWDSWEAAWKKRNQEIRNLWLNRRIRILDVREFKQQVREHAEQNWEYNKRNNQELRRIIFAGYGRQIKYIYIDWGDTNLEGMQRKRFNELHPRDAKGRFVKK